MRSDKDMHAVVAPGPRYFGDVTPNNWTYRPSTSLSARALLDANTILDATFIRDGLGMKVIAWLRGRGIALYTAPKCLIEANKRILELGRSDLVRFPAALCGQMGVLQVTDSAPSDVVGVARHDVHVANAASVVNAFVISDDAELLHQLDNAKISARSTRELAFEMYLPAQPPQEFMVFETGVSRDSGHVFFKGIPDDDMLKREQREYTLFENRRFGRMFFDAAQSAFVFACGWADRELRLPATLQSDKQVSVLLSYRARLTKTNVTMKAHIFGEASDVHCTNEVTGKPPPNVRAEHFRVMNSYALGNGWKGTMQHFTGGPNAMRGEVWRACRMLVGVCPPILTMDLTRHAVLLSQQRQGMASIPTLEQVMWAARSTG
jgi:hypothetical protein